jgi:lipoprotein-anchoring transpeptidase ErfK/SrfK
MMRPLVRAVVVAAPLAAVLALSACRAPSPTSGQEQAARHQSVAAADPHKQTARGHQHRAADRKAPAQQTRQQRRAGNDDAQIRSAAQTRHRPVNHCRRNGDAQKAIVSLAAQHMWMCHRHRTVHDTAITSGMAGPYTHTPTGNYWIQGRNRNTTLTLNTGATYAVRYWIPFDAPLFGFHDSSWQHFPYGSPKYRTAGSHGCIHMPLRAIAWFYNWVARPTAVHIS